MGDCCSKRKDNEPQNITAYGEGAGLEICLVLPDGKKQPMQLKATDTCKSFFSDQAIYQKTTSEKLEMELAGAKLPKDDTLMSAAGVVKGSVLKVTINP